MSPRQNRLATPSSDTGRKLPQPVQLAVAPKQNGTDNRLIEGCAHVLRAAAPHLDRLLRDLAHELPRLSSPTVKYAIRKATWFGR